KLAGARRHLMRTGRWAGAPLPVGYMVDMRETVNGKHNTDYRRIVPFEPYARVVREYFQLFIESGGSLYKTVYTIYKRGIYLPNPAECQPPEGFKIKYQLTLRDGGYYLGREG